MPIIQCCYCSTGSVTHTNTHAERQKALNTINFTQYPSFQVKMMMTIELLILIEKKYLNNVEVEFILCCMSSGCDNHEKYVIHGRDRFLQTIKELIKLLTPNSLTTFCFISNRT